MKEEAPEVAAPEPDPSPKPDEVMGFGMCATLRVEGEAVARGDAAPPSAADGELVVWPVAACAAPDGWAGISYQLWRLAGAFSADGRSYLECGGGTPDCAVLDVKSGKVKKALRARGNLDDAPAGIFSDKGIEQTADALKLTSTSGRWPADDTLLTWTVTLAADGKRARTVRYALRERQTGAEIEVARFEAPPSKDDIPSLVVPAGATLSPDGRTLAVRATIQEGQSLRGKLALRRVTTLLRGLYAAAAAQDPAHAEAWRDKVRALAP